MTDTYNRFLGARSTYAAKKPVRAASTGNLTLSGFQTVDGVTYASSDDDAGYNMRILVKDQDDSTQNGVYLVNSGDWSREKDFDGNTDFIKGTIIYISQGTVNGGRVYMVSSAEPQSIGVNSISFSRFGLDSITKHGADVASATTIDLDSATGEIVDVTGTTGISAITLSNGMVRVVRFTGSLLLVHGASLVLPGAQNITTAAGDYAVFVGYSSGVVRCIAYQRVNGHPLITQQKTVASATTTDLGSDISHVITVSGSVAITSFGSTAPTGAVKFVYFSGAPLITHNGTSLILPGAQNIQSAAGDALVVKHEGSGNWRVISYMRANSQPLTTGLSTLASASTVDLGSVRESHITITGTSTISSFGSSAPTGVCKCIRFSGSLTLTYNGTSMILPGGTDITVMAGDMIMAVHAGSGNWVVSSYTRAVPRGMLSVNTTAAATPTSTSGSTSESDLMTYSLPADTLAANGFGVKVTAWGVTGATTMAKEAKLYFGATAIGDTGTIAFNDLSWRLEGTVIRTSAAAQVAHTLISASSNTTFPAVSQLASPAETLSTAVTIKISALCTSTGVAEVTANGMTVEFIPTF